MGNSLLTSTGLGVDSMRDPKPDRVIHNYCKGDSFYDDPFGSSTTNSRTKHLVFWPASLVALAALGAGGVVVAGRRLRVPAGKLPRGVRLA